jgi:hypothetical protein
MELLNSQKKQHFTSKYYRYGTFEFTEETTLATIQADFLALYNALEFYPAPIADVLTPKE